MKKQIIKLSRSFSPVLRALLSAAIATGLIVVTSTSSNLQAYGGPGHRATLSHLSPTSDYTAAGTNATEYFSNWSGYAATSSSAFNSVEMTFTQPAVSCPYQGAWTLFWVGFDGFNSGNVEQAGTSAWCNYNSPSEPTYYAWWEMYPT